MPKGLVRRFALNRFIPSYLFVIICGEGDFTVMFLGSVIICLCMFVNHASNPFYLLGDM